ncbi:Quercetin 2 like protein [Verticillium longisporum]|nr:Quercetin 2 like protein [Verticillium longisporum]
MPTLSAPARTPARILDDRGLPVPWAHTKNFPKQQLAERRQKTKALDLMRTTSPPPMLNSTIKSTMSKTLRHARISPHRSGTRGHSDHGWLNTYHSFSFADWYNPDYTHFGALRVLNEDRVKAQTGFPTHPHRDFEIFSYILSRRAARASRTRR